MTSNLSIFANIRISSKERLQHLKDSFFSFQKISDNWVINVRGSYRKPAIKFLKRHLRNKLVLFELLDDKRGWMTNSLEMIKEVKNDYLLNWNEDHVNIAPQSEYKDIIKEMTQEKVDYMIYSWWHMGKYRQAFDHLSLKKLKKIDTLFLNINRWKKVLYFGHDYYLLSSVGIFRTSFFKKLLLMEKSKLSPFFSYPIFVIVRALNRMGIHLNEKKVFPKVNKIFGNNLSRYPKETPHELEKDPYRTDILPIKISLSKRELFACIDDNLGQEGYSLVSRGLYPPKKRREL